MTWRHFGGARGFSGQRGTSLGIAFCKPALKIGDDPWGSAKVPSGVGLICTDLVLTVLPNSIIPRSFQATTGLSWECAQL
jgi:hypothetical protein